MFGRAYGNNLLQVNKLLSAYFHKLSIKHLYDKRLCYNYKRLIKLFIQTGRKYIVELSII
jgi:hypothetical protein